MTLKEAIELLELYNKWRRDEKGNYEMPDPKQVGIALDILLKFSKDSLKIKK